jgi:hypothetical protein
MHLEELLVESENNANKGLEVTSAATTLFVGSTFNICARRGPIVTANVDKEDAREEMII